MSTAILTVIRKKGRWVTRMRGHKIAAVISIDSYIAMSNARRLYGCETMRTPDPWGAA